jgi:hypothetical protein
VLDLQGVGEHDEIAAHLGLDNRPDEGETKT